MSRVELLNRKQELEYEILVLEEKIIELKKGLPPAPKIDELKQDSQTLGAKQQEKVHIEGML